MEKEGNELGMLFQQIVSDIKASFPLWEDFTNKATKLHSSLRLAVSASTGFLDAFQKLADSALSSRGSTKDVGSSLTRLCLRQKAIENRMKNYTASILESLVAPLQDHMDEWKKSVMQLEKDHIREVKKCHSELKKSSMETSRLQKKVKKGKMEYRGQLEASILELNSKFTTLETTQKNAVAVAVTEERSHFCQLISCMKPLVDQEMAMLSEVEHLREIMESLTKVSSDSSALTSSEQVTIPVDANRSAYSQSTLDRMKKGLKEGVDLESVSNSSGSTHASLDALNLSNPLLNADSSSIPSPQLLVPSSPATDRTQTLSSGSCQSMTIQPHFKYDTHSAPNSSHPIYPSLTMSNSENPYAVPNVSQNAKFKTLDSTKVVDKIYARPALLMNRENGMTLKRVLPPTIPNKTQVGEGKRITVSGEDFVSNGYVTQTDLVGLAKFHEKSSNGNKGSKLENQEMSSEMQSLADVLRELEVSTAMLQMPYETKNAQSCQSLQCSSGYGTMTNVSISSAETVASDDLDALASALLASCDSLDFDKYATLPSKSQANSSNMPPDFRRHASAAGLEGAFKEKKHYSQQEELPEQHFDNRSAFAPGSSEGLTRYSAPLQYSVMPNPMGYPSNRLITHSINEDDDDDLPPPPPPEDIDFVPYPEPVHNMTKSRAISMHADVMQSLHQKLSLNRPPQDLLRPSSVTDGLSTARMVPVTDQKNEENEPSGFECQIRRGVKLRHTICNDRSAPRFKRN